MSNFIEEILLNAMVLKVLAAIVILFSAIAGLISKKGDDLKTTEIVNTDTLASKAIIEISDFSVDLGVSTPLPYHIIHTDSDGSESLSVSVQVVSGSLVLSGVEPSGLVSGPVAVVLSSPVAVLSISVLTTENSTGNTALSTQTITITAN